MELIIRDRIEGEGVDNVLQYHEIESLAGSKILVNPDNLETSSPRLVRDISFVTGSRNKVAELEKHVESKYTKLTIFNIDLVEIQDSSCLNIAEDKCRKARQALDLENSPKNVNVRRCVLVEDTSLHFKALKGLPGPYIKWFLDALGPSGLYKMLDGFDDKSAEAVCTYALIEKGGGQPESRVLFFKGSVQGRITSPRGSSWGWDPIFEENRTGMTFGEMDAETKAQFSHRANAITVLKKYLSTVR